MAAGAATFPHSQIQNVGFACVEGECSPRDSPPLISTLLHLMAVSSRSRRIGQVGEREARQPRARPETTLMRTCLETPAANQLMLQAAVLMLMLMFAAEGTRLCGARDCVQVVVQRF